jgi:membrane dipeptidase
MATIVTGNSMINAKQVHDEAIVIDAVSPLLQRHKYIDLVAKGGVTCIAPTVGGKETTGEATAKLGEWLHLIAARPDLIHVKTAADIERAKKEKKLGILFHFQGTQPFELDLNLVEAFHALGVRMVMLTYNVKNYIGDGCEEPHDGGLSRFGESFVKRLNSNRIVVDVTHTGYRTTMEAMEVSTQPVVFSHSNARAVFDTGRNIADDQAKAAAKTGGLVGVTLVPYFIRKGGGRPALGEFVGHIDHFVRLIGIDHVGLGLDFYWGQQPFASDEDADATWQKFVDDGIWDPANYPKPPHYYPAGLATPAEMGGLTEELLRRGYSVDNVKQIMGLNWLRVFRTVWGS